MYLKELTKNEIFLSRLESYIKESEKTVKKWPWYFKLIPIRHFTKKLDSLHATIGLSGELLEEIVGADDNNEDIDYKEEYGDLCWYLALYIRTHNINLRKLDVFNMNATKPLTKSIGVLAESSKKWMFYPKTPNIDENTICVYNIIIELHNLSQKRSFSLTEALNANIEKLSKRYNKNKFTLKDALERKDKKNT